MTEYQAWCVIGWLFVIGVSVADSVWEGTIMWLVFMVSLLMTVLVFRRFGR